ncbi:MAG: DUF2063 domain-containing protein, partial [Pseudomonadota bacterium]
LYGEHFADFIQGHDATQDVPYIADVARIERAWLTAYHAADRPPLNPADLGAIAPEVLGNVVFAAKPGTAIVNSRYATFTIFAMNRDMLEQAPVDASMPEHTLITRPDVDVIVTPLTEAEAVFFAALLSKSPATLAEAAEAALGVDQSFDLNAALSKMIGTGAASNVALRKDHTQTDAID